MYRSSRDRRPAPRIGAVEVALIGLVPAALVGLVLWMVLAESAPGGPVPWVALRPAL